MAYDRVYYGHKNIQLTDVVFNEDETSHYLSIKFKVEDEHSLREVNIPKIRLWINPHVLCLKTEHDPYSRNDIAWVNLGFGDLPLDFETIDGNKVLYTETVLEEKYTEMTLDEIEKKLGHKIKIVNR